MKKPLLSGLLVALLAAPAGCNGGQGDEPGTGTRTAAEAQEPAGDEIPGGEIPGVEPRPTKLSDTDDEIPGVRPPADPESTAEVTAYLEEAVQAERDALREAGDDEGLADLASRSTGLDSLDGYEWRSGAARELYERAKSLDATGG
ncbi:hypothetical protein [Symbioplanes lichenis]|uniref:hypothetical protein n=1 Tax=Symbioplanes lichenis TaxID=1629072 RepID=UPI002738BAC0|nr:hypothetical protein [Actinoplanes lichenis]